MQEKTKLPDKPKPAPNSRNTQKDFMYSYKCSLAMEGGAGRLPGAQCAPPAGGEPGRDSRTSGCAFRPTLPASVQQKPAWRKSDGNHLVEYSRQGPLFSTEVHEDWDNSWKPRRASTFFFFFIFASQIISFYDTLCVNISFYSRIYCRLFLDILFLFGPWASYWVKGFGSHLGQNI